MIMEKEILVECFKSNNHEFVEGKTYEATISNEDLQTFMINMQDKLHTELREDVEFANGEFNGYREVGFRIDPSVFEQKLELVLRLDQGKIINNAEELKSMLSERGNKYNYIVDKSNYDQAKKDRTSLNKLSEVIFKKRKAMEEELVKEWEPIKKDLMECEKLIKSFGSKLGDGIAVIDDVKKNAKKEEIKKVFLEAKLPEPVNFELIWDSKWANSSTSEKKWKEELQAKIDKIKRDFKTMAYFLPNNALDAEQVKQKYLNTLDLGLAEQKSEELLELRKKVEQKQQEAVSEEVAVQPPTADVPVANEEVLFTRTFKVVGCTKQQIIDLGNYMNANGILFEKVEM